MKNIFKTRFSLLVSFIVTYIFFSFTVRLVLYFQSLNSIDFSILSLIRIFSVGLFFDFGAALFFLVIYDVYLLLLPSKFTGSIFDKIISYLIMWNLLFISFFAFIAEFTFWNEFNTRFNFIAVDYLIYTNEVIGNINQSYPIPFIILLLLSLIASVFFYFKKNNILRYTFTDRSEFKTRIIVIFPVLILSLLYIYFAKNRQAEWSTNLYENELSKNGVFSFAAAYRSNELNYDTFYAKLPAEQAYNILKGELLQDDQRYTSTVFDDINRDEAGENDQTPNVILITIESLSADFLKYFGNDKNLTPNLDLIAQKSIFFTKLYATGTRTVRGMEALTLSVPPTPGNSIVRRPDNDNIFSIATIFKQKNYSLEFIYGGDGYFDNMNAFFGGQGFDIIDRNRGNPLSENIKTNRYSIKNEEVTFENIWGVCDEDLYAQAIKYADLHAENRKPFFQFIMTASNHTPYTFPDGKIDLPQGSRKSAVKYTDFALGEFLEKASTKPWFTNTVFVIVADHCHSSAGKWEINIDKHHIPAIIYNFKGHSQIFDKLASQIDLMPTLFGLLDWNYRSEFYGKDITKMTLKDERALIGNYRTLGLLKDNVLTVLNDRKKVIQYNWDPDKKGMSVINYIEIDSLKELTISYYQTASERAINGKMKQHER